MTDDEINALLPVAAELSCAVADYDPEAVAEVLTSLDVTQLYGLAVLLAAHVDVTQTLDAPAEVKRIRRVAVAGAARGLGVREHAILSRVRDQKTATARAVAMTVARRAGLTTTQVAHAFDRDHATVISAVKKIDRDPVLSPMADHIGDRLTLAVMAG